MQIYSAAFGVRGVSFEWRQLCDNLVVYRVEHWALCTHRERERANQLSLFNYYTLYVFCRMGTLGHHHNCTIAHSLFIFHSVVVGLLFQWLSLTQSMPCAPVHPLCFAHFSHLVCANILNVHKSPFIMKHLSPNALLLLLLLLFSFSFSFRSVPFSFSRKIKRYHCLLPLSTR